MNSKYDEQDENQKEEEHTLHNNSGMTEQDAAFDHALLAAIDDTIASRNGTRASSSVVPLTQEQNSFPLKVDNINEIESISIFSARLASTMPRMGEQFHDDLLARLMQELPEAVEPEISQAVSMPVPPLPSLPALPAFASSGSPYDPKRPQPNKTSSAPLRNSNPAHGPAKQGWLASSVTALAGVAVLLLVLVGMAFILEARQTGQKGSNKPLVSGNPDLLVLNSNEMASIMQPVLTLPTSASAASIIKWSPDSSRLAVAELVKSEYQENYIGNNRPLETYLLHFYNANSGEQLGSATLEDINSVGWSPDGSLLAVGLDRFSLKLFSRDGQERYSLSTPFPNPDQQAANGASWGKFTSLNKSGSVDVAWSPDGHLLASAAGEPFSLTPQLSADGAVRLWDPATGRLVRTIKIPADPTAIYNDESGHALSPGWVKRVLWTPNGHLFLPDGAGVWDPETGQQTQELANLVSSTSWPPTSYPYVLAGQWSPNGSIFSYADDIFIRLTDPATGQLIRSLPDALPPTPVPTVAPGVSLPMTDVIATAQARLAQDGYSPVYSFVWSPDSKRIANVDSYSIRVWDASTGKRTLTIPATYPAPQLAWSPDGRVLVGSASGDGVVSLWDSVTGQTLRTIEAATNSFAWSPDGRLLAVSTSSGVVLWGALVGQPTSTATPTNTVSAKVPSLPTATVRRSCGAWQVVPSASVSAYTMLTGVAATAPDDAWAVGFYSSSRVDYWLADAVSGQSTVHTLIEHWDGSSWRVVRAPDAGSSSYLLGVAVDRTHAWAVGYSTTSDGVQQTLILSWDGTTWQDVSAPNASGTHNRLIAVTALAPDDVWAVGSSGESPDFNSGPSQTLILHFDGSSWSIVPSPSPSAFDNHLTGISAASQDDIWAVGFQNPQQVTMSYLALHWNGSTWETVPQLTETKVAVIAFSGVAATASGAWITGGWSNIGGGSWQVSHITTDGRQSNASLDLRSVDIADVYLSGVIVRSQDDVWAVGNLARNDGKTESPDLPPHETLIMHWNGSTWSTVASPSVEGQDNQLAAIAAAPGSSKGTMWAVGWSNRDSAGQPLILQFSDCAPPNKSPDKTPGPGVSSTVSAPSSPSPAPTSDLISSEPRPLIAAPECGLTWSPVTVHTTGATGNPGPFSAVATISSNDVWAVGYGSLSPANMIIAHWDGLTWTMVDAPDIGTGDNKLFGVAAISANNIWAVGSYSSSPADSKPLVVHWDGSTWAVVTAVDPGPGSAAFQGVTAVSPNDVWAVGSHAASDEIGNAEVQGKSHTLIEHWD